MPLPAAVEKVTVTFGPFLDFTGTPLAGTITFTPVAPGPIVHVPTGTPIVRRPVTVTFGADTGSGTVVLPATNATGLTVTGFAYAVTVRFAEIGAETWPAKTVQLPKERPTADLDLMPDVVASAGAATNIAPAVVSIAGLTGAVSGDDLANAIEAVQSPTIRHLVIITQAAYDALPAEAPATLYVIADTP
jgi:hypothetical protein